MPSWEDMWCSNRYYNSLFTQYDCQYDLSWKMQFLINHKQRNTAFKKTLSHHGIKKHGTCALKYKSGFSFLAICSWSFTQFNSVPWPIGSLGGTWRTIQQRSSSNLFGRRPLWAVLAWAGMSTLWLALSFTTSVQINSFKSLQKWREEKSLSQTTEQHNVYLA